MAYAPYVLGFVLLCGLLILVIIDLRAGFCLRDKGCEEQQYCKYFVAFVLPCPRCIDLCEDNSNCGAHAHCTALNHEEVCVCDPGFTGDPSKGCQPQPAETCEKKCGSNTNCNVYNNSALCGCKSGFSGNPYDRNEGCIASSTVDAAKCWSENRKTPSSECVAYFQNRPKKEFVINRDEKASWFEAQSLCESEGQMLAIIENRADQEDMDNKLIGLGINDQKVWLAGSDLQFQGKFQWVAGSTFNSIMFTNWGQTEPEGTNQHCLASERSNWISEDCSQSYVFVCMNK